MRRTPSTAPRPAVALAATVVIAVALAGCIHVETDYDKLPPGPYRGVFYLDGRQSQRVEPDDVAADFNLRDVARDELPFNFELRYTDDNSLAVTLVNGEERIAVPDVAYERLLTTARDSVTIRFPLNDTYFTGYHEDGILEGSFVDETRDGGAYRIPVVAEHGRAHRFTELQKAPAEDLTGTWSATFGLEDGAEPYAAVAEFEQRGNELAGTFRTATGDYRYLAGTVQEDRMYLSTFDGGHVFLFSGKLQDDGTLLGLFRSGNHYQTIWSARRDPDATLPDPTAETTVLDPEASVALSAYDIATGATLDPLGTPTAAGRHKVVTLMGSWCPNCKDEALFLDSLRATVPADEVAFLGLAYERFRDTSRAVRAVERFRENLGLGYPIYLAGFADKREATERLGFLDRVRSFPTLLLLDENDRVVYTHTGFEGPATSAYRPFAEAFAKTLQNEIAR